MNAYRRPYHASQLAVKTHRLLKLLLGLVLVVNTIVATTQSSSAQLRDGDFTNYSFDNQLRFVAASTSYTFRNDSVGGTTRVTIDPAYRGPTGNDPPVNVVVITQTVGANTTTTRLFNVPAADRANLRPGGVMAVVLSVAINNGMLCGAYFFGTPYVSPGQQGAPRSVTLVYPRDTDPGNLALVRGLARN